MGIGLEDVVHGVECCFVDGLLLLRWLNALLEHDVTDAGNPRLAHVGSEVLHALQVNRPKQVVVTTNTCVLCVLYEITKET